MQAKDIWNSSSKLLEDNHLLVSKSKLSQLQNYLYRYRQVLIAKNYPEIKIYLSKLHQNTWNNDLKEDEMFSFLVRSDVTVFLK